MSKNKVLVSVDELNRLKACEATLYAYQDVKGLCPESIPYSTTMFGVYTFADDTPFGVKE